MSRTDAIQLAAAGGGAFVAAASVADVEELRVEAGSTKAAELRSLEDVNLVESDLMRGRGKN